jgi:aminopeptidase N
MLQMMYFSPKEGAKPFKEAMQDFVATYRNRTATTEDFKAVMERHLPPQADINGDHRLDWFFDEYVYGTEVPRYTITSEFSKQGDATIVKYKITQSSVSPQFAMTVPVYLEFENKSVKRVANVTLRGSTTAEGTANLGNLGPSNPTRLLLNYYHDVLSAN